jgi:hypothetical protein
VNASLAARSGVVVVAATALILLFAPRAHAGVLVSSATSCDDVQVSQPFTPWLDSSHYFPIGSFENGAGDWTLSGGASVTSENEPWHVGGSGDSQSLSLPAGSSATSPVVCVGIDRPSIRVFARRDPHGLLGGLSTLKVDALVVDDLGNQITVPVLSTMATSSWAPTVQMPVLASLLPLLPGDQTPVAFKFTVTGSADWHMDDVYVDPWRCC